MYSLGEYFSEGETLNLEFKEFFLKISPDIFFSESEIKEIITTGKWTSQLNSLVIINVKSYINYYLGKYNFDIAKYIKRRSTYSKLKFIQKIVTGKKDEAKVYQDISSYMKGIKILETK